MISWGAILTALRLFGAGALDGLLRGLSAVGKWLLADWRNFAVTLLAALYVSVNFFLVPRLRADLAASEKLVEDTQLAHLGTISNFIDASAKAQADAEANVERVKAEQERINDATLTRFRAERDALRARFKRLRAQAASADPRRADPAGLPAAGDTAGRAAEAAGEDRLPASGGLSLDDALIASEQAVQLDALIDWIEAQSAVRFNPEPRP